MKVVRPASVQPIPDNAKMVFKGVLFEVWQWEQQLYDGSRTIFEKLRRLDTVVVLPVMDDGRIILTEEEQPGKEPFVGSVGGRVEEGEDVLEAAKRELLEETGYEASEYILWDAQHPASKIDYVVYTFIAKGIKRVADMNPDAGEKITLKPVSLDEFIEIATEPSFSDKEILPKLFEAKLNPEKYKELTKLFSGK